LGAGLTEYVYYYLRWPAKYLYFFAGSNFLVLYWLANVIKHCCTGLAPLLKNKNPEKIPGL
jgi:hypothetical protein